MTEIHLDDPARMNLLGLFVRDIATRNLARPKVAARARNWRGRLVFQAGPMAVTLHLEGERICLERGAVASPTAAVQGDLATFLALGLGRSPIIAFLRGQVRVRGNIWLLLRALSLLQVP